MLTKQTTKKLTALALEVTTFPAVKLGKLPLKKTLWKFADELTLVGVFLFLILVGSVSIGSTLDSSPFAKELLRNPERNIALSYRILSSIEESSFSTSLFPQARADEVLTPPSQENGDTTNLQVTYIDEQGLRAAIPDSLQPLLNAQVMIYEVKAGDTLKSIAENRGISTNTVKWANNLEDSSVEEGWFLVLPSTDGVLVQTDENTTISEIAEKFSGDPERILSYNGLPHPDAFTPGQYLMCPDCKIPTTVVSTADRQIGVRYADIPNEAGSTHTFYPGHCTWYVAKKFKVTFGGSARYWIENAKEAGYEISQIPVAGSVAVTSDRPPYGHVAYVESVDWEKGIVHISEMNYKGLYIRSERDLPIYDSGVVGYILPKY